MVAKESELRESVSIRENKNFIRDNEERLKKPPKPLNKKTQPPTQNQDVDFVTKIIF